MSSVLHRKINRRALLIGSGGFAAAALLPRVARTAMDSVKDLTLTLTAAPGRAPLVGASYPSTDVWCYGNSIPGPEFRVRQGEPVRVVVRNQLSEDTTVHLHGIRLPNAMDGVPGLTQPPIKPGEQFTYEFTPPDAGTFWYHPHADSLQQLGRGMAGALIVEEPEPIAVDRDILWMLGDWRLTSDAQIARGFGNAMEAGASSMARSRASWRFASKAIVPWSSRLTGSPANRTSLKVAECSSVQPCASTSCSTCKANPGGATG